MSCSRKIVVFGMSGIKSISYEEGEISFPDNDFSGHLADYDIIIYSVGVFAHRYERSTFGYSQTVKSAPAAAIQRENEIHLALERGKLVCFIGGTIEDYVVNRIFSSYQIPFGYFEQGQIVGNLTVRRSEFKSYIDDVGATQSYFSQSVVDEVICYAYEDLVTGFSKKIGKGLLLFIPTVWGSTGIGYVVEHLKRLTTALVSYSTRVILQPPKYISQFQFREEKDAREEINKIMQEEIRPLQTKLERYEEMKSILWLGDKNLELAINTFLQKIGFLTQTDEIYEEDLWIMSRKEKQIMVEVKGLNKNLTRQDISKLDEHREAREVPQLTGLLIANTFRIADSIENKNEPFPPNVIEKSVNSNLLITRTIDLCRIVDYLEETKQNIASTLTGIMLNKRGWLTIQNGKIMIIH